MTDQRPPALRADAAGKATAQCMLTGVIVSAGSHSIVGKRPIVHEDADDYTTQTTGSSGARSACGVILAV